MGSQSYDPPSAPSYEKTEMDALNSYLMTSPKYRAIGVRNELGSDYVNKLQAVDLSLQDQAKLDNLRGKVADQLGRYDDLLQRMRNGDTSVSQGEDLWTARQQYQQAQEDLREFNASKGIKDVQDIGNLDIAKAYGTAALDLGDEQARRQLALRQELGVRNVEQTRKELIAADPEGYWQNNTLKSQVFNKLSNSDADTAVLGDVLTRDRAAWQDGNADLAKILADTKTEYGLGAKLDESTAREVEQAARQAQASRGNILGIGAASQEAMALGSAGEARKQQRLANYSTAIGAVNTDNDRLRSNLLGTDTAKYAREQQGVANKQSFYLGTPLSAQFSTLGAAGGGAVNYNPAIGNQGAQIANGNAGSQYALGVYGQQSQNAATAASQGNPWMNMAMGVAGTALGAYTGGLGAGFAAQSFANGSAGQDAAIGKKR